MELSLRLFADQYEETEANRHQDASTEPSFEAVMSMTNLGNILVDHHGVLQRLGYPEIPNVDALSYWFNAPQDNEVRQDRLLKRCGVQLIETLWGFGREHPAVFAMLVSIVLHKKSVMTLQTSEYYTRLARIISMELLRESLATEGVTESAIVAIAYCGLLARWRGDMDEALMHFTAGNRLLSGLPLGFVSWRTWAYVWWTDASLALNTMRRPLLPYYIPAFFTEQQYMTPEQQEQCRRRASANLLALGFITGEQSNNVLRIFSDLYKANFVASIPQSSWYPSNDTLYNLLYFNAYLGAHIKERAFSEVTHLLDLLSVALRLCMLANTTHLFLRLGNMNLQNLNRAQLLVPPPSILVAQWRSHNAKLTSLLWICYIFACESSVHKSEDFDFWMQYLRELISKLHISTRAAFERTLRAFPDAALWNKHCFPYVWHALRPPQKGRWQVLDGPAHPLQASGLRVGFNLALPFVYYND